MYKFIHNKNYSLMLHNLLDSMDKIYNYDNFQYLLYNKLNDDYVYKELLKDRSFKIYEDLYKELLEDINKKEEKDDYNDLKKVINDLQKEVNDLQKEVNDLQKEVNELKINKNTFDLLEIDI